MQVTKGALLTAWNCTKSVWLLDSARTYSAPHTPWLDL